MSTTGSILAAFTFVVTGGNVPAAQIAYTVGSAIDASNVEGPSPGDLAAPDIQEGAQLVRPYGTIRLTVHPVSVSAYTATPNDTGGKGGPPEGSAGFTYTLDVLGVIAHRVPAMPILAITRVWVNKKLVHTFRSDSTDAALAASAAAEWCTSCTLYPGGSAQMPPPAYEDRVGTANASAYRNVATVEIIGLVCGGSKTPPLVEVEVITAGTQGDTGAICRLRATFENNDADDSSYYDHTPSVGPGISFSGGNAAIAGSLRSMTWSGAALGANHTTQAWTLETLAGFNYAAAGSDGAHAAIYSSGASLQNIDVLGNSPSAGLWRFRINSSDLGSVVEVGPSFPHGAVAHCAIVRPAGATVTARVYVEGIEVYAYTASDAANVASGTVECGTEGFDVGLTVNYVGVRFEEQYTTTFVPPSDLLPADSPLTIWTPGTVNLQDIVDAELAANGAISAADHDTTDLAGVSVRGFKAAGPPGKTIAELGEIFYFDCVPSSPIRYQLRGAASSGTILNADTGAGVDQAGEPFTSLKIGNDVEVPSVVGLSAPNASADHEPVFRRGDRLTTEGPELQRRRTEVELTPAEVQGRSLAMSLMARASAHTAEFGLSDKYAVAEPGDPYIVFDDQANQYNLFIRSLTYADGVKQVKWELNDTSALVEAGITDDDYTPSLIVAAPVESNLVAIDGPILQDADDDAGHYTAIEGEGAESYTGGIVRRSVDDLDFTEIATTHPSESVVGVASTALGNWTGGYVWDEVSSVVVVVGEGQTLSSSTADAMQANRATNAAFIGAHGRWEVIRFRTATLGAARTYTLTGLLRGVRGTEAHIGTHVIGDTFVLATAAGLRRASGAVVDIGATRYLKAVTNGRPAASSTSEAFVNQAVGLKPFSPSNLRATRDGSNNVTFTWDRRTRYLPRYGGPGGSYTPLGEASERYEVDVYASGAYAAVLRTISSTSETASYTAAQQTTDGLTPGNPVFVRVYQLGAAIGRGTQLQASA